MASRPSPYVLIVDDHPDQASLLCELVGSHGIQCTSAFDGAQAIATIAERGLPSVLVTDLEMPRVSGAELAERVARESNGNTFIVVMSGVEGVEFPQVAHFALRKPLDAKKLQLIIQAAWRVRNAE